MIIDCKKIRENLLADVTQQVQSLPFVPVFCDVLVGDDSVSLQYVNLKRKTAESVGIKFRTASFPQDTSTETVCEEIENLNRVPHMCGIIVQLPLPAHINVDSILNRIEPKLDVDCLNTISRQRFFANEDVLVYPTAKACLAILDSLHIDFSSKKIVVLGQGNLVGKPVTHLLRTRGLDVGVVTRTTIDREQILASADVIISAIGVAKYLKGDMIKKGAIVIDAGTSEEDGGVVGDVDSDSIKDVASFFTSTPGGVGPVTVAMLLQNVLLVAQHKNYE